MKNLLSVAALAASLVALSHSNAAAGETLGVVELFTSQGCNSCPPADEALARLAKRGDVIALGYHVDYWDYLGWRDTLGSKANTERQYDYARSLKQRGVYTPQAIINGRSHANGARYGEIESTLRDYDASDRGLSIDLSMQDLGDRMRVTAKGGPTDGSKVHLVIVYFRKHSDVKIDRGENTGKTIGYVNAVIDFQTIGMWDGEDLSVDIPKSELSVKDADGCAVLLQKATTGGHPGAIIGAAILPRQTG